MKIFNRQLKIIFSFWGYHLFHLYIEVLIFNILQDSTKEKLFKAVLNLISLRLPF